MAYESDYLPVGNCPSISDPPCGEFTALLNASYMDLPSTSSCLQLTTMNCNPQLEESPEYMHPPTTVSMNHAIVNNAAQSQYCWNGLPHNSNNYQVLNTSNGCGLNLNMNTRPNYCNSTNYNIDNRTKAINANNDNYGALYNTEIIQKSIGFSIDSLEAMPNKDSRAKKTKRNRTSFTEHQLKTLETEFKKNRYITQHQKKELAKTLNVSEKVIKIWFQNKRMKEKNGDGKIIEEETEGPSTISVASNWFIPSTQENCPYIAQTTTTRSSVAPHASRDMPSGRANSTANSTNVQHYCPL